LSSRLSVIAGPPGGGLAIGLTEGASPNMSLYVSDMDESAHFRPWWRPPLVDVGLALAMGAYALYDVLVNQAWAGPVAVNAVVVTAMTLSLAFRRTLPLAVLMVVGSAIVGLGVAYGSAEAWSSVFPFVVAVYSAAAYSPHLWVVVVAVATIVVLRDANDPYVHSVGDALFSSTLAFLSVMAGVEGRRLRQRSSLLDNRAEDLARDEARLSAEAAADERRRIARELHDIISHGLGVIVLQAGAAEQIIETDPDRAREVLRSIRGIGQEAIGELGGLLGLVREGAEPSLEPQPTLFDLPELVERARSVGMDVELDLDRGDVRLSPALELSAYRIVQEGLTNAQKHAPGARVVARVEVSDHELRVSVLDDGPMTEMAPGGRRGLAGMAERVAVFGGQLRAGPGDQTGWSVNAVLPVPR
jgi:signal transduction histidine kinase